MEWIYFTYVVIPTSRLIAFWYLVVYHKRPRFQRTNNIVVAVAADGGAVSLSGCVRAIQFLGEFFGMFCVHQHAQLNYLYH